MIEVKNLDNFIVVGDKVLIKPKSKQDRTKSGLYLPPGIQEKEQIHSGYIMIAGPAYPIPAIQEYDEPWKEKSDDEKYIPLQAKKGDLAVYLHRNGHEIEFNKEKYIIVPHTAILALIREDSVF